MINERLNPQTGDYDGANARSDTLMHAVYVRLLTPLGGWWASVPRERWPEHPDSLAEMKRNWSEPWGDRRQELVFIGSGMDWAAITERLDAALVDTQDFRPSDWKALPDPFPQWGQRRTA